METDKKKLSEEIIKRVVGGGAIFFQVYAPLLPKVSASALLPLLPRCSVRFTKRAHLV